VDIMLVEPAGTADGGADGAAFRLVSSAIGLAETARR
jgi:hypothetical protein